MFGHEPRNTIRIPAGAIHIDGILERPREAVGVVLFAHGTGSGRMSPRNNYVAAQLRRAGLATLLLDLLTPQEDLHEAQRYDVERLTGRLASALHYLESDPDTAGLPAGLFGASTGAAAALRLAATEPERVRAVVSRGGRPDLAGNVVLARVRAPTLLIVGGLDTAVIDLNETAFEDLSSVREKELRIVPGATHLFEETGTLEQVARLAGDWFCRHLPSA